MKTIQDCLLEKNATVEALGQGKQSILIRNYENTLKEFLLYPTIEYLDDEKYLDSFQDKHHSFIKKNSKPDEEGPEFEVKYYAKVEEEIKKPAASIETINKHHMWTDEYVNDYMNADTTIVWLLRVYKLKEPVVIKRTNGMVYADVDEAISVEDIEPVLSDAEFNKLKKSLK
ncbi:MAG: DUF1802 family protein [Methanobacteriaceae archaeon]|nr:DUF1802 family protein [Methanobacteriaceae archaeon]